MAISLRPYHPDQYPPGEFQIPREAGVYRVGRDDDNEMQVPHPSISARHALIEVDGEDGIAVVDCGSSNGTWVNGNRVLERCALAPGDTLNFANLEFRVFPISDVSDIVDPGEENGAPLAAGETTRPVATLREAMERESLKRSEEERERLAAELGSLSGERDELTVQLKTLAARLAGKEKEIRRLLGEKEAELSAKDEELHQLLSAKDEEITTLGAAGEEVRLALAGEISGRDQVIAGKEAEILSLRNENEALSVRLEEHEEEIRRLRREGDDAVRREERLQQQLSESRAEVMAREGDIAALNYEMTRRDASLSQLSEEHAELRRVCDQSVADHAALRIEMEKRGVELADAITARNDAEKRSSEIVTRLFHLSRRLLDDWKDWFPGAGEQDGEKEDGAEGLFSSPEAAFARVEDVADRIRRELDLIEPIWHQFGEGVQEELRGRCDRLREEEEALLRETEQRRGELGGIKEDLAQFRALVDTEVRRVQGLSRRGTEIEIPERFESMIIARDHEQEIYRALIERLEDLDHHLDEFRGSRKLRTVVPALEEFRSRLAGILESSHVRVFEVDVGTMLTLKHRKEVQILSRKGWGTKQYTEYPFQPGEVTKVIRPGYRVGEDEYAVILRKVEVLIRGVEE